MKNGLLTETPRIVNVGLEQFNSAFESVNAEYVRLSGWKPPAQGNTELVDLLLRLKTMPLNAAGEHPIEAANKQAVQMINKGNPVLIGVKPAGEVFPELDRYSVFHAGPPIAWERMCGPMQGAVIGALLFEGLAKDVEEAAALAASGQIKFSPNHHHGAVGPMTGMITRSMPVFVVENAAFGNRSYCTINEGLGEVLRFGANGPRVIERLHWLAEVLAPVLDRTVARAGGINLRNVIAKALAMGDEMHQRNVAASLLFYREISVELAQELVGHEKAADIVQFMVRGNEQFFLNLAMAAGKAIMDPVRGIPYSTVVTAMSRNGVDFGIQVSGLGDQWFTAPVMMPKGLYFPGYTEEDANPDMGDSTITECFGIGGFAMACAPSVTQFVGAGSVDVAAKYTRSMGDITVARNPNLPMPIMNFEGVPTGIDICKVVDTGVLPVINTGIAHKKPGIGQVGAGIVHPPIEIFQQALRAMVKEVEAT
jgi:hypothetical protein